MALIGTALGSLIAQKIQAIPGVNITDQAELKKFCDAIGEAVVEHIQQAATVTGSVTSGNGAGGAIVGTVV